MDDFIIQIAKKIEQNNGDLYLVGGAVRDEFLGIKNKDEDYCVVGITHDKFIELFPEAISRGKTFEVFDINGKEFALARLENKTGKGHKDFEIITNKDITIYDDLKRRDLTINALYLSKDLEVIDYVNGQKDLENKVIKMVGDPLTRIKEDPLRIIRIYRFHLDLGFSIDPALEEVIKNNRDLLNKLRKEKFLEEIHKCSHPKELEKLITNNL